MAPARRLWRGSSRAGIPCGTCLRIWNYTASLGAKRPPLAFLDFEAVFPAIPRWPACGPYTHVPVQMSCHLEDGRGGHRHFEWLADGPDDPRPAVAAFLVESCAGARSIVAYNAAYEARCIRHLAQSVSHLAAELGDVERRLVDLLPVVAAYVYHPLFDGSFSLKNVVPALAPDVRYHGMGIADGRTATNELTRILFDGGLDPQERSILREEVLAYCKQDTWAMVRLLRRLRELKSAATPAPGC